METNTPDTFGRITIIKAKDSDSFKERITGFVARLPGSSEYYGATKKQAVRFCIEKVGTYAF